MLPAQPRTRGELRHCCRSWHSVGCCSGWVVTGTTLTAAQCVSLRVCATVCWCDACCAGNDFTGCCFCFDPYRLDSSNFTAGSMEGELLAGHFNKPPGEDNPGTRHMRHRGLSRYVWERVEYLGYVAATGSLPSTDRTSN